MSLKVIQAGLFTTIQDLGRPGYRDRGVPIGGAFDRRSAWVANALLGNDSHNAVLEFTGFGGHYEAMGPLGLAVAGAPFRIEVEDSTGRITERPVPSCFPVAAGSRVKVGTTTLGARCYLAVVGGWRTGLVLGSRSSETRLVAGANLEAGPSSTLIRRLGDRQIELSETQILRFIEGPDHVPGIELSGFGFQVRPESNRMGVRFEGPRIDIETDGSRLSAPVAPGAVQIAGGLPIILGVAAGTIGGYPHVAHLISSDLDRLAQLRPGQSVRFQRVTLDEARALDREDRTTLARRCLQIQAASLERGGD